ncbi:scarecrow-like protein 3 [Tripterygium wilfordii]|uniref:Scarecrow-like protein 3 n=1 Tax=Tripterygium wilfordii TaxID=458696 RepID=A0A7J7CNG5_TRIWF|nr:scarecrow-like protein 3 [Tripterygium wilfordii]KAF5735614.1 scarecrow-like protein 3 [Tripterygium wilfordii]
MTTSSGTPSLSLALSSSSSATPLEPQKPEERGLRLIQLLLTCANHTSSGNLHRADACLRQISKLASISGDSMQRLAAYFASALAIRLVKRWPGLYKALNKTQKPSSELDRARPLFVQAFPYLSLAYAIMGRTLLQCMMEERVIHIVDLGFGDSKLWVPLLRSFANSLDGPPHLRITCVHENKSVLEKLGRGLVKEAERLRIPFHFSPVNVGLRELTLDQVQVRSGEAMALISFNLHVLLTEDDRVDAQFGPKKNNNGIKDCKKLNEFLSMVRSMSPKILFLVGKEADHNLGRLVDRFIESLHYYSAVFDSIEVTFGGKASEDRFVVEEMFGREIENIVACEGLERLERHERYGRWAVRFGRAGFRPVGLWYGYMDDAKKMLEACGKEGYKITSERQSLMICWHDRPLYSVSAWIC